MSWDDAHGCAGPGKNGSAKHDGDPLTVEQIKALSPGERIVVTWSGGNGPWEGSVAHDEYLGVCYVTDRGSRPMALLTWPDPIPSLLGPDQFGQERPPLPAQTVPLNRVTLASRNELSA